MTRTDARWLAGAFAGLALIVGLFLWAAQSRQAEDPKASVATRDSGSHTKPVPPVPTGLKYVVLRDDTDVIAWKRGRYLDVLVSGDITEENLESLLRQLYSRTMARPAFGETSRLREVMLAAYASREHFDGQQGQWIAFLRLRREADWNRNYKGEDTQPSFMLNWRQMKYLHAKPDVRFGLSEALRKEANKAIWDLEARASNEAGKLRPFCECLRIGQRITLAKPRGLYGTLPPTTLSASWDAWQKAGETLPAGTTIRVTRRMVHKEYLWYYVQATRGRGAMRTDYGSGYMKAVWIDWAIPQEVKNNMLMKQGQMEDALTEKYRKEVAQKHGITVEQLKEIGNEGFEKDWPASSTHYDD